MRLPYPSPHDFTLILAPMAGVSEPPFRQICRRMGADVVLSEFLSSEAIRRRIRNTLEGAEFEECERPIGLQIYGAVPTATAEATALIGNDVSCSSCLANNTRRVWSTATGVAPRC